MAVTTTEEYKDVLKAQRTMSKILDRDGLKASDGAQVTRALIESVRLKRDMRGIPDPRPADMAKPKRTRHQSQVWGPSDPSSPDAPTK